MRTPITRAFTFVEIMVVVVIVGVLAAIVVPQFGGVTEQAKTAAAEGGLGGVRAGIAGYRAKQLLAGNPPYPTVENLLALGVVMQTPMPANPWSGIATIQAVSERSALSRTVTGSERYGWNYFVDNGSSPPRAIFYANTEQSTTVPDPSGGFKTANEL